MTFIRDPDQTERASFIVAASVAVPSQSEIVQFSSQLLAPPFRLPYLIREIRFLSQMTDVGGASGGIAAPKFQQVKLAMGQRDMTRDFVPIGLLCPQVQRATDESFFGGADAPMGLFRWVLPKPMYCRAGEGIFAAAQNVFSTAARNFDLEISVVGEVLPEGAPIPKTTSVPYVSVYSTNGSAPNAASDGYTLKNPWSDKVLHMQRFIGRGYLISEGKWVDADSTSTSSPLLTLVDSEDRTSILPPQGVFFGEAFDARTNCLEHHRPLPPKGWFQSTFQNIPANSTYDIAMIGHREEAVGNG